MRIIAGFSVKLFFVPVEHNISHDTVSNCAKNNMNGAYPLKPSILYNVIHSPVAFTALLLCTD